MVSSRLWQIFFDVVDYWPTTKFVIYLNEKYPNIQNRDNLEVVIISDNNQDDRSQ